MTHTTCLALGGGGGEDNDLLNLPAPEVGANILVPYARKHGQTSMCYYCIDMLPI